MISRKLMPVWREHTADYTRRQSGRAVTRTALILTIVGVLVILAAAYLSREELQRYFLPLPPPPTGQAAHEEIQAADLVVSHLISSLGLTDDHISRKQFSRNDGAVEWDEQFIVITLPPETSLHQVEHVQRRTCAVPEPEALRADVVYDNDSCLHITIFMRGRVTHQLFFHAAPPPVVTEKQAPPVSPYRIALVIDDLGENYGNFKSLSALGVPITYAILPFRPHSVDIAAAIHANGSGEIILHLPLEPWNSANHAMNHGTLLTSMDREELLEQLEKNIKAVPHISGVNSHMGSKFTENSEKTALLLEVLKEKGLYFLDSRTSKKTVGYALAKKLHLKTARRDLFLDSTQDEQFVLKQLKKILPLAQKRGGTLIVIGHPYTQTIRALQEYLPSLTEQGVTIVPLSELVH